MDHLFVSDWKDAAILYSYFPQYCERNAYGVPAISEDRRGRPAFMFSHKDEMAEFLTFSEADPANTAFAPVNGVQMLVNYTFLKNLIAAYKRK